MNKLLPLVVTVFCVLVFTLSEAQTWTKNLPQEKLANNEEFTFYEIQKAFNDYWDTLNVDKGYYFEDGIKQKAGGWKQFKRWEWFWENRVDPVTGEFPKTSAAEIRQQIKRTGGSRNADGNWLSLGPSTTPGGYAGIGRLNCVAFVDSDPLILYVGSPSGGLWKTTDGGDTWEVLTDDNDILGVSDILVYPGTSTSTDTVYIATGDRDGGSLSSLGGDQAHDNNTIGVLKSIDGGTTWATTGLTFPPSDKKTVNRLLKYPGDSDIIYAASTDGVFKTTDGGSTWPILSSIAEFIDMEFNPTVPEKMYGSTRTGEVYTSDDGGSSWLKTLDVTDGLRVELAVSMDETDWVYAVVVSPSSGLEGIHKSEDEGETWVKIYDGTISGHNLLGSKCDGTSTGGQGKYDLALAAKPDDALTLFVGGINTWKSTDGGSSWTISNMWKPDPCGAPVVHADKHYFAYQPGTGDLFECNDGGLYKTTNGGTTWDHRGSGLVISQLYRLGVSQLTSNNVIAGLQDNGTKSMLSGTWDDVIGGDGMECFIDYTDDAIQYGEYIYGTLYRTTDGWSSSTLITTGLTGFGAWVTPFSIDPVTHETIYTARDTVWKSTDKGTSWAKISDFDAGGTFRSLAVAPSDPDTMYVATKTKIWATYDGGSAWTEKTGSLPVGSSNITYISVNSDFADTLWVAMGEYNTHGVYQSTDAGTTWTSISSGLPEIPVMCVIQNRQNTSEIELYAATDVGVYVKDGSADWELYSSGLPNVVVTEIEIYYDDSSPNRSRIRAATYGRGLWESELYSPAGAPIADFDADETTPLVDSAVVFTDISNNDPASWAWTFTPSTVTYLNSTTSTSQNPEVAFDAAGSYEVKLTATNAHGSDTEIKTDYITVVAAHKWVGTTSTDWSTTTNWDLGTAPDETKHVIVESGASFYPEILDHLYVGSSGTSSCNSLTIKSGGLVTVGSFGSYGHDIIVFGNLKVEAGGTLKFSDDLSIESGGKLYVTGGSIENFEVFGSGYGDFYLKSGSGGHMTSGSIIVYSDIKLWGGDWYASGGTFHCGGSGSPVVIESDDPNMTLFDFTIDEDVSAYISTSSSSPLSITGDFTQEVGSMFSVSSGESLLITGDALLKSDATGAASLINLGTFTVSGTSTVERYVTDDQWHLLASPVSGETAASLYFGGSPEAWLQKYDEASNTWEFITSLSTPLTPGMGFTYWIEDVARSDKTISFDGPLTSTDLTLTDLDFSGAVDYGFNAVGNPFPSAIDFDVGSWDTTSIYGNVWVWKDGGSGDGSGTYSYRNAQGLGSLTDGIIPMAQGFFVRTKSSTNSLTIPADARVHSSIAFYKNSSQVTGDGPPYLIFVIKKETLTDEAWLTFCEECDVGFDNGWDVSKLSSSDKSPQMYFLENELKLSIDALPSLNEDSRIVNLNIVPGTDGDHLLVMDQSNKMDNTEIFLEDLLTGAFQDMIEDDTYEFNASKSDNPNRFLIHLNPLATEIEPDSQSSGAFIYSWNKSIYISLAENSTSAVVEVYDLFGRKLIIKELPSLKLNRIPVNVSNTYLIVKVVDEGKTNVKKVFIR